MSLRDATAEADRTKGRCETVVAAERLVPPTPLDRQVAALTARAATTRDVEELSMVTILILGRAEEEVRYYGGQTLGSESV